MKKLLAIWACLLLAFPVVALAAEELGSADIVYEKPTVMSITVTPAVVNMVPGGTFALGDNPLNIAIAWDTSAGIIVEVQVSDFVGTNVANTFAGGLLGMLVNVGSDPNWKEKGATPATWAYIFPETGDSGLTGSSTGIYDLTLGDPGPHAADVYTALLEFRISDL